MSPLVRCTSRALLVGGKSLVDGRALLLDFVAMSVGVAVLFAGTYSIFTAVYVFNSYFR